MVAPFNFAATPKIIFGSGKVKILPTLIDEFGSNLLLISGRASFTQSDHWDKLLLQLEAAKIQWLHYIIDKEPTPLMIDDCISRFADQQIDVIVAIGGGSVIDAGKAISAMFCQPGSVRDYLEGVGKKQPSGNKIAFIAVPTTAGTGAETTKNAVISEVGENGYKRSLRHDRYVPDVALVDPELTLYCPASITAQSGMDAFTQLLESYLSTNANPITDALAVDGIRHIRDSLVKSVKNGLDLQAREKMSCASMLSGITLANAGLGTVHGFASSIGGFFNIPHGLVCARMMEPVNSLTIEKLRKHDKENIGVLKYARIGKLFSKDKTASDNYYVDLLMDVIRQYTDGFNLPGISEFGVKRDSFKEIIFKTGNKNNPIELSSDELDSALEKAL